MSSFASTISQAYMNTKSSSFRNDNDLQPIASNYAKRLDYANTCPEALLLQDLTIQAPWNAFADFNCPEYSIIHQDTNRTCNNHNTLFGYHGLIKNEATYLCPEQQTVTPSCKNIAYPSQQHPFIADGGPSPMTSSGGTLTWQQSILQKKPKEEYTQWLPSIQNSNLTSPANSEHSMDEKFVKKRSIADQDLISAPSVVSSISEPIRTSVHYPAVYPQQPRKRTRSLQHDSSTDVNHHNVCNNTTEGVIKASSDSSDDQYLQPLAETANFVNTAVASEVAYSDNYFDMVRNNQMLAAIPRRQKLRYEGDHYTPKWVRYTGHLKEGYCDSCNPGKWLQLKNSAYWYHKQFYHGISSVSGKPFIKPIEQRMGKGDIIEGLCHQCHRFVPACNGKKKNNYMLWYRHAHKCHLYDKPKTVPKTSVSTSSSSNSSISSRSSHPHSSITTTDE
ncbi:hypothetical protein RMCBS344292_14162 [Rhizopus microsporus]|nr:hypothetical protein RMCBS344292_14162 [Rhizopus microsporus]